MGQNHEIWEFWADAVEIYIVCEELLLDHELSALESQDQDVKETKTTVKFQ
jgi:hypothetical protein